LCPRKAVKHVVVRNDGNMWEPKHIYEGREGRAHLHEEHEVCAEEQPEDGQVLPQGGDSRGVLLNSHGVRFLSREFQQFMKPAGEERERGFR